MVPSTSSYWVRFILQHTGTHQKLDNHTLTTTCLRIDMPPLGTSPCSRPALAGWDCRRPRAPARRPIGWPGPMPSVCSANGARPSRTGRSAASLTLLDQPAYGQLLKHEGC